MLPLLVSSPQHFNLVRCDMMNSYSLALGRIPLVQFLYSLLPILYLQLSCSRAMNTAHQVLVNRGCTGSKSHLQ